MVIAMVAATDYWLASAVAISIGHAGVPLLALAARRATVSFKLATIATVAIVLVGGGAGRAQVVAFRTGWSVYAFYRTVVWGIPFMGVRFVVLRVAVSVILPITAGVLSGLLFSLLES